MTSEISTCKVMWKIDHGGECGIAVQVFESDTDETVKDRAWALMGLISPTLRAKQKSDLKIIRRKEKK